jgi:hypothetical protein
MVRPTKRTPTIEFLILLGLAGGKSRAETLADSCIHINRATFQRWIAKDPNFAREVHKAEGSLYRELLKGVLE